MRIIFLTGNKGKMDEALQIIPDIEQKDIDLPEIQSIDAKVVIKNKLEEARKQLLGSLVVEDTSLYLEAINGLPGPLIKWFMKTIGNEGLVKIAKTFGDDKATAKVVIGYISENDEVNFFEGAINGKIVEPRGENGFGWDPIFEPDGEEKTFAEMDLAEKNNISMRKIAFIKLREYLESR